MARKKKSDIVEYKPSPYQERIFDFIQNKTGNLIIEAAAGSGKTWTLLKSLELIPSDKQVIFLAFNKTIVDELRKKTKGMDNINVSTLHSLGYNILKDNCKDEVLCLDMNKYRSYLNTHLYELTDTNIKKMNKKTFLTYKENIFRYVDLARNYLCNDKKDFLFVKEKYDIEDVADEMSVAEKMLVWGMNNLDIIDFTDMVWLPNILNLCTYNFQYDYIMADECQDINKAERFLILKCIGENSRLICVGDSNQAIYSFAGSDPQSFKELKKLPNMTCMPLPISYRCASSIVKYANQIVPSMESSGDGRVGEVKRGAHLADVKDGDMMICRNNAPLTQVYCKLIQDGKKAHILGKDMGKRLINMVTWTGQELLNVNCHKDGVFARLYSDLFKHRNRIMTESNLDERDAILTSSILDELDRIKTLEYLSDDITTAQELVTKLEKAFGDSNKTEGVFLSTIHKAKGLEADSVFVVAPELMPSKSAKKDWEVTQERNLMYVAYTRAKNHLLFLDSSEIDTLDMTDAFNLTQLRDKEEWVDKALSRSTKKVLTLQEAAEQARRAKPIILANPSSNTISMNDTLPKSSFGDIWKKQTKKVKHRSL